LFLKQNPVKRNFSVCLLKGGQIEAAVHLLWSEDFVAILPIFVQMLKQIRRVERA